MIIFLIAEVTAISLLVKYLSGNDLWITSLIVLSCSMIYTLYMDLEYLFLQIKFNLYFLFNYYS